ncbi:MAG: T9SS type A sorting domain-containing protein [Nitrososphaerales archaeon]
MKIKILFILILVVIYSSQIIIAQESVHSTGPIPKIKIDNAPIIISNSNDAAWSASGHTSISNQTVSLPLPEGYPIGYLYNWAPSTFASSMAANPPGFYYITETGPPAKLHQTYGYEVMPVGEIIGMGTEKPNGIAYNTVNHSFYLASSTNLYSFELLNLAATLIGPFNTGGNIIDLCFNEYGVCFAYDIVTDCAYTINISTGEASLLGPLGYDANFGQGMSYDYETQTIYLSAFNNSTFTGQLRTMNPQTGMTTLVTDWGINQIAPFECDRFDIPCIVQGPYNPNPILGATGIQVTGTSLSWTNSTNTTNVELWFGPIHNVVKVYDGPAISSYDLPTLIYNKQYIWRVICKNEICGTPGLIWSFTTEPGGYWCDEFNTLGNWTIVGPSGLTNWSSNNSSSAGGTAPELMMSWDPAFNSESKIRSVVFSLISNQWYSLSSNFFFDWYGDQSGIVTIGITYDSGATSTNLYTLTNPNGNVGPTVITGNFLTPSTGLLNAQIEITFNGNSFNIDNIYWDNMCISGLIPVELISFTSEVDNNVVTLLWQTATETNNSGFEIERLKDSKIEKLQDWERIGFVEGKGTTTEIQSYSFTDKPDPGIYKYRLKQIDYDGTFAYSSEIEVEVKAPNVFSLEQNFPNPFNPTTKIKYTIPEDVRSEKQEVLLKVYDVLGNEISILVNELKTAGSYEVEFEGSKIPSGIYFYQLKANSFVETKKMVLLK